MSVASDVRRGVVRGHALTPYTESVARRPMNGRCIGDPEKSLRVMVFLEVEVMVEQREDEDAADEIAPWEMWS